MIDFMYRGSFFTLKSTVRIFSVNEENAVNMWNRIILSDIWIVNS